VFRQAEVERAIKLGHTGRCYHWFRMNTIVLKRTRTHYHIKKRELCKSAGTTGALSPVPRRRHENTIHKLAVQQSEPEASTRQPLVLLHRMKSWDMR
jgi:hypothetical protein